MKVNITLNDGRFIVKRIKKWGKTFIDVRGLSFHYGEPWVRWQRFYIPKELRKETKETILQKFNELIPGEWFEYTHKP